MICALPDPNTARIRWSGLGVLRAEAVRHIERIGLAVPGLNERLRCYQVVIGLDN